MNGLNNNDADMGLTQITYAQRLWLMDNYPETYVVRGEVFLSLLAYGKHLILTMVGYMRCVRKITNGCLKIKLTNNKTKKQ
jgi:hypothetical protein